MKYNHRHFSTPLIIASGLIIAISGVMMFFHIGKDVVKLMHEWIGLIMAAATLLHIQFHWRSFKQYFSKKTGLAVISFILLGASALALTPIEHKPHPDKQLIELYSEKSLEQIASFEERNIEQLLIDLEIANFSVSSEQLSLKDIAQENHARPFELINAIINPEY
ncbi:MULTISPECIES: DUF4405 domain-containing protein [unclassified Neptuniibacter]|jgi:hypothetical protein|uniref:DUF4405 domain-containing protein n=1 Tax=unclassified Neptuniibacter TaxID=2630693 RepID=UPI0026E1CB21|nr:MULTISPECIES: DUF4405 domain-containing protein [unclassified Neptuniibacter]MDO6512583.1 DUF4405 domain-containing protein [Neptuniibacter sp. 2_MG-2023]MDO6593577.1 DUF4405 domain-containing protein [Neptuniibacter sp. 1_MG-2023]